MLIPLLFTTASAQNLPNLGEAASSELSPQAEQRLGDAIIQRFRQDPSYMDDAEITGYLNGLGATLLVAMPEAEQRFQFFVVRDNTLNAFALPGGYIGVHTGLILAAQSESELASVLAHEISHVTQRHLARMFAKQSETSIAQWLALAVGVMAVGSNPEITEAAIATSVAGGAQSQLNYSRDFEREADRLGLQTLDRSGFDPYGMPAFFERLQQQGRLYETDAPGYLRTHPMTVERLSDMENRVQTMGYRQVPDSLAFQLVRSRLKLEAFGTQAAIREFETQLRERKFTNEAAVHYGLSLAWLADGKPNAPRQNWRPYSACGQPLPW